MNRLFLIPIMFFTISICCFGQDSLWQRTYDFGIYNNYDLRNSSTNMIGAFRLLNDGFNEGVVSKMKNPKIINVSKGVFSFATVYLAMVWSHEFGHSLRAKQVGGNFNIHNFGIPIPYTTADLPPSISLVDEAIFVTAGFEVNYLNVRKLQAQFVRQNGLWNEDLGFSFANRLMYPIYTTFIVPIDPEDKKVWIETAGDPVHYILPVFKNYSDGAVFLADSIVNPELVSFYNQATIFGSFFQLLDPQFYREAGAAFGKSSKVRRPIFLIGDFENGWTYGTLFNASPLGYELYFQNYLHLKGQQFGLYVKYGRPYKNVGLGVSMNNFLNYKKLKSDVILEVWQQDIFGSGGSLEIQTNLRLSKNIGFNFNIGYKTEGYVLGKQLKAGPNLGFGVSYYKD
jgi:hypothetical protein